MPAPGPSLHHLDLAPRPSPGQGDGLAGTRVSRNRLNKKVKHMFGAVRCPQGQQLVVAVGQRPAAPDRH
jgi:hypothetical protein